MERIKFYHLLENSLPNSTAADRISWAAKIIEEEIDIKYLSKLLQSDKKVAIRFSWLLSEIGAMSPNLLLDELPVLFELSHAIKQFNFTESFATYWRIVGVPAKNEAAAIGLLFNWLQLDKVNVTTKSRSLAVLFNFTQIYPDLKNELRVCLESQMGKNTEDFDIRASKILKKLTH